ncbi:MAG: hypothetical protein GC184_06190 [Rhizobiales bacterium]|nr:hypothetical protein [Hyphomicrobiales bacterium]
MKFTSKLGIAKGVERARIWLEGARLTTHGFTPGTFFVKEYAEDKIELRVIKLDLDDVITSRPCKVSGKGDTPIIDITGQQVADYFGTQGTHVDVTYTDGLITIVPAAD